MQPIRPADRFGSAGAGAGGGAVARFEASWGPDRRLLDGYWRGLQAGRSPSTLIGLIKVDLRNRFRLGQRPTAADYLGRFPELAESGDHVVSLVYEEFCLLEDAGESPDPSEFCRAYPAWRDSLRSQLAYHRELSRAIGAEPPPVDYPKPGDRFEKYRLLSVLGTGGMARVYLASEDDLGGRKVALKLSATFGQEPAILGALDHRHIVPVLTEARSEESGLRGLCMPYKPGLTLDRLVEKLRRGPTPRTARQFREAISPAGAVDEACELDDVDGQIGWLGYPASGTYAEAVAWIGRALAQALDYLHDQGVYHRDIKPANILLAHRDGPQLLDFNLAQGPHSPEQARAAQRGGTLPYMAPEQLRAFLDRDGWEEVGGASDVYALGLVLLELATGRPPEAPSPGLALDRAIQELIDRRGEPRARVSDINPFIPPSLESIVEKCLAFDPSDRYGSAADLAEDLGLFLERRPLAHAQNTSGIERGSNWLHRNRHHLAAVAAAAVAALGLWLLLAPPPPIPRRAEFLRAEALLRQADRDRLIDARRRLESIQSDEPNSAWPRVYLALARSKLGEPGKEVEEELRAALAFDDAEPALRGGLDFEPRSAPLWTWLGKLRANRHQGLDLAREDLLRAIRLDPDQFTALLELAKIEEACKLYPDAIDRVERALRLAEAGALGRPRIVELRVKLPSLLLKHADQILKQGRGPEGRARAWDVLDRIEPALEGLRPYLNAAEFDWNETFYRGAIASGRAVVEWDRGASREAERLTRLAWEQLDMAEGKLDGRIGEVESRRKSLNLQFAHLEERESARATPAGPSTGADAEAR